MPFVPVRTNTQACRAYLKPCSVHVTWKTLLPSDRHNQSFVWINLTEIGVVAAETSFFRCLISQKVVSKFKNVITQRGYCLPYTLGKKER